MSTYLTQEIADLKQRVTKLETSQTYINTLRVTVQVLEHKINQLSAVKGEIKPTSLPEMENLPKNRD